MLELDEIRFHGIESAAVVPMTTQNLEATTPYPEWMLDVEQVRVLISLRELGERTILKFGVDLMGKPETTYEIRVGDMHAKATLNAEGLIPGVELELDVSAWAEAGVGIHDETWEWE